MHDTPGIADVIQTQRLAAQTHRLGDTRAEKPGIHRLVRVFGQYPQRDARMPVVKTACNPHPGVVHHTDQRAGLWPDVGLLHHFLEDPRMGRARSEEYTSELQSLMPLLSSVFCLYNNTY